MTKKKKKKTDKREEKSQKKIMTKRKKDIQKERRQTYLKKNYLPPYIYNDKKAKWLITFNWGKINAIALVLIFCFLVGLGGWWQ